ncbi:MAG: 30S ribosomal protein S8 [Sulfurimonas sp.]|jgi:small subunit ribosomal protein S8|nr:30S ribosomal protein S8 [Campylobacterales bacterium]
MINDLIADSLTRIRNAAMRRLDSTTLMHSKTVEAVVAILADKGYVESFNVIENGVKKTINVVLKYDVNGRTVINEVKRISKSGRRVYKGAGELKRFKNGYGTIIVSSSKGVLPNDKAFELGVGGEVLCTIW